MIMNEGRASKKRNANLFKLKQPWSRSDKIAMWAFAISILSTLANVAIISVATNVAYKMDQRAHQSDVHGAEAVVAAVGDKVRLLAQSAEYAGMFLEAFIGHVEQHPENVNHVEQLRFEFLQKLTLPDLTFSTEQLALLAHSDSDAASKLAVCASRRAEVESDIKSVAAAKTYKLMMEQTHTLSVLPYRLHRLSETCNQATKSLTAIAPALPSINEPLRGTLGEIAAAQEAKERRKDAGLNVTLEIPKAQNKQNSQDSQKPSKSNN
jgi:hypothetical protein